MINSLFINFGLVCIMKTAVNAKWLPDLRNKKVNFRLSAVSI